MSSTLRDLVIGSGLEFEERGAHELEGRARRVAPLRGHVSVAGSCGLGVFGTDTPDSMRRFGPPDTGWCGPRSRSDTLAPHSLGIDTSSRDTAGLPVSRFCGSWPVSPSAPTDDDWPGCATAGPSKAPHRRRWSIASKRGRPYRRQPRPHRPRLWMKFDLWIKCA